MWEAINGFLKIFAGFGTLLEKYFSTKSIAESNATQAGERQTPSIAIINESMSQDEKIKAAEEAANNPQKENP